MKEKWKYLVTLRPGVSIAPDRFVEIVEIDGPNPIEAAIKAAGIWMLKDAEPEKADYVTHSWQSNDLTIRVERVA